MSYTATIGLSAFLLFLIQPLVSKMLLPYFGGGASIWIASLVFFQTMLLMGYGLTHLLIRRFGIRRHMIVSLVLLGGALACLPISATAEPSKLAPSLQLFLILLAGVGLPYLLLATTSPTLQYWMANDSRAQHRNPYVQYGISNLGSLGGLLAYPFLLEPQFATSTQSVMWTALFIVYALLLVYTALSLHRAHPDAFAVQLPRLNLTGDLRGRWIFQAMVPSALLLVVTHYLILDVVNFPLLWVAPLCLYLTTFILCFVFPALSRPTELRSGLAIGSILFLLVSNHGYFEFSFGVRIAAALACLFFVAMVFHGDLERGKPDKQDLTDFYLQVSAGGALGSIIVGIIAPLVFVSNFELYVVLIAALYYLVTTQFQPGKAVVILFRGAVGTALALSWVMNETSLTGDTIYRGRSFYSTYAVREPGEPEFLRRLVAGTHIHGMQFVDGPDEHRSIAYYHERTGVYQVFEAYAAGSSGSRRVAAIGLGIGSVVEYGGPSDVFDLYELDPLVIDIANTWFTVLPEAAATLNYLVGDGRVQLRSAAAATYDMVILDAFTSGSIPMHLLTVEALEEVDHRLKPGGAIVFHISNHFVDLQPVLNGIAGELGFSILVHESPSNESRQQYPAVWVVLTRNDGLLRTLADERSGWKPPSSEKILWRDDDSTIWSVLR